MKRKIILGILTFLPLVHVIVLFSNLILGIIQQRIGNGFSPPIDFELLVIVHLFVLCLVFFDMAYYIRFIYSHRRISKSKKQTWIVLILFGNMFAIPFFWYYWIFIGNWKSGQTKLSN